MNRFTCLVLGLELYVFENCSLKTRMQFHLIVISWVVVSLLGGLTGADFAYNFTDDKWVIAFSALGTSLLICFVEYSILISNSSGISGFISILNRITFALLFSTLSVVCALGLLNHKDISNTLADEAFQEIKKINSEFDQRRDSIFVDIHKMEYEKEEYHTKICIPESYRNGIGPVYERKHAKCISLGSEIAVLLPEKSAQVAALKQNVDSRTDAINQRSAGISKRYSTLFKMMKNDNVIKILGVIIFGILMMVEMIVLITKYSSNTKEYDLLIEKIEMDQEEITAQICKDQLIHITEQTESRQKLENIKDKTGLLRDSMKAVDESMLYLQGLGGFIQDIRTLTNQYPELTPTIKDHLKEIKQTEGSLVEEIGGLEMFYHDLSTFDDILKPTTSDYQGTEGPEKPDPSAKIDPKKVPLSKDSLFHLSTGMIKIAEEIWRQSGMVSMSYAKEIYHWICENITYNHKHTHDFQMTAREVYNAKTGQCLEMGILFVAMMRYKNLDCQAVYVDKDHTGKKVSHGCALLIINNQKILVDPALEMWDVKHVQCEPISDDQLYDDMIYWNA